MSNRFHIFYHRDADGFCAGHVIYRFLVKDLGVDESDIRELSCIHKESLSEEFDKVEKDDFVFILDYSFPQYDAERIKSLYNDTTKNIVWIDHHATSQQYLDADEVYREIERNGILELTNRYAGCLLTQIWVNHAKKIIASEIQDFYDCADLLSQTLKYLYRSVIPDCSTELKYIPHYVRLVSDHDTFIHEIPGSREFVKGCSFEGLHKVFFDEGDKLDEFVRTTELQHTGAILMQSEARMNENRVKRNMFYSYITTNWNGVDETKKIAVLDSYGNSDVFGEIYNEVDAVCLFTFDGLNFNYSMYSRKEDGMIVAPVAKYFGEHYHTNGGGHDHAAGWSSPEIIFTKDSRIIIPEKSEDFWGRIIWRD
jgi:oligoribonuclease NrnB/cAMP/cGMP phosphodiesterase (DHH superfamily)